MYEYRASKILFRGEKLDPNNNNLQTTLARSSAKSWTLNSYCKLILNLAPEIESYIGRNFNLPMWNGFEKVLYKHFNESRPYLSPKLYGYLIYLRQHGFPSPLLDWSASPYIAAYFAFAQRDLNNDTTHRAIFAYIEHRSIKFYDDIGQINVWGPSVKTLKRHFLQQAWYSMATKILRDNKDWQFTDHDKFYEKESGDEEAAKQDILIKITIPTSERIKVLTHLDRYNLNQFSLFETEDDLIKTIAFREIDKFEG